jgi:hypothetical protein
MDLLLEEIFKCLPSIQGAAGSRSFGGDLSGLHVRGRSCVFFYGCAELVKGAVIPHVFWRNPRRNRLCALELRSRIEKPALFAAMQLKTAFRTFAHGIEACNQDGTAIRTTRPGYRADHAGRSRSEMIRRASRPALRRFPLPVPFFSFFLLLGIPIAAVTVLAIHKRLRPSVATDCNFILHNHCLKTCLFPRCIQSERYKRSAHQSSPLKLFWNAVEREQKMGQLCL